MMFASVFTKTVRDRSTGVLVAALSTGLLLVVGMAVYRDVDVGVYFEILPPSLLEMMGIPEGAEAGGLAFGAMYNLIGAFVLAGLAISMGASGVAGEEQDGTIGLLLGNPLSRYDIVVAKGASLAAITGVGALILWGFAYVSPAILDVDMAGIEIEATILALFLNALVYGFLALAIGSWTGSRNAASGVTITVMVVGYLGASLLPLVEDLADLAKIFPWYYFSGSRPVVNGVDPVHTSVLAGMIVVFSVIAYVGIGRRDLRQRSVGRTIFDRLRENPRTQKMMETIAGTARVSRISIKTSSEFQGILVIASVVMFLTSLMMGPIYAVFPDDMIEVFTEFPDALIAMIGGADMSTAAGFIQAEVFSITAPIAVIVVTAAMGSRAIAGEEERHTMGLLMGNPTTFARIVFEKTLAMIGVTVMVGLATFLGTWFGVILGGVESLPVGNIAATTVLVTLMGLMFGGMALAIGAATGRSRLAAGFTAGVAVLSYFMFSFFPLSEAFEPWADLSPFTLYLGSDPLTNGMAWGDAAILTGIFLVLVIISPRLVARRDLRG